MKFLFLSVPLLFFAACKSSVPSNICSTEVNSTSNVDYEKIADKITYETARKIERQTSLHICGVGGGSLSGQLRKLNMSFECRKELNMEQGRKLVLYCVNEYLSAINANKEIRPNLIHFPFTPEDVEIDIFIQKPDRSDVPIGSLSVVSEVDGKVIYKVHEPDPIILRRVHEETFEEALKLVGCSRDTALK